MNFFDNLIVAREYLRRAFAACPNCSPKKGAGTCPLCLVPYSLSELLGAFIALHQPATKPADGKEGEAS